MNSPFPVNPVSRADEAAVHSYFDICPESPDGRHVVYTSFVGPEVTHTGYKPLFRARLVVTDPDGGQHRTVVDDVLAGTHEGAMQQWVDDRTVAFGAYHEGQPVTVLVDIETGRRRRLPGALRMVSPDGRTVVGPNNHERPVDMPQGEDGVTLVDLETGRCRMALTRDDVLAIHPFAREVDHPEELRFKHTKWSPSGRRFFCVFHNELYRKQVSRDERRVKSLIVYDMETDSIGYLSEFFTHPFWGPDDSAIWTVEDEDGVRVILARPLDGSASYVVARDVPVSHASLSPGGTHLACDRGKTPREDQSAVTLVELASGRNTLLAHFNTGDASHQAGCHPHPTFSRDGRSVYFNSYDVGRPQLFRVQLP